VYHHGFCHLDLQWDVAPKVAFNGHCCVGRKWDTTPAPREALGVGKCTTGVDSTLDKSLLRQYLPKSADLSQCTQRELDAIARSLNTRPRQTLGWMTPSHAFANAVATTG
jgi:hypothetical protein